MTTTKRFLVPFLCAVMLPFQIAAFLVGFIYEHIAKAFRTGREAVQLTDAAVEEYTANARPNAAL